MRLKKEKKYKTEFMGVRCTEKEKAFLLKRAALYCDSNLSEYLIYCGLNFVVGREDLEDENKKPPLSARAKIITKE